MAHNLDFFVLFSSISGIIGNPGQANYASANTFLDSFVQFRHAKGLAASVIDIGVMGDVGYVSNNQAVMEQFKEKGTYILQEQDLLDSIELAIKVSHPARTANTDMYLNASQLGIGFRMTQPILSPGNRSVWKRDARMSIYHNLEAARDNNNSGEPNSTTDNDELKNFLSTATSTPDILKLESSAGLLSQHIGATLLDFMMKPVEELDVKLSPIALGMDSLVSIELRNWCRQRFGLEVSVLEILGAPSIEQLGSSVAKNLMTKLAGIEREEKA